jgi:hypothetical protein
MAQDTKSQKIGRLMQGVSEGFLPPWQLLQERKLKEEEFEIRRRESDTEHERMLAQIDHWESEGDLNKAQADTLRTENDIRRMFIDSIGSGRSLFADPTREEQRIPYESITPDPTASILRGGPGSLSYDLYGDHDDTTQTTPTTRRQLRPSVSDYAPSTGPMRQEAPGVARPQPTVGDQPAMRRPPQIDPHFFGRDRPLSRRPLPTPSPSGTADVNLTMQGTIGGQQSGGKRNPFSNLNQDTRQRIGYDMMGWPNVLPQPGQRPDEIAARLELEQAIRRQSELEQIPAVAAQKGMVGDVPLYERRYKDPETGQERVEIRTQPQVARSLRRGESEIFDAPLTQAQQTVLREMAPTVQSLVTIESILPHFEDRASANVTGLGAEGAIGPLAGPISQLRTLLPGWTGLDDDLFNRMNVEVYTLLNNTVRMITGAQMSNPEAARIKKQVPSINDRLSVFKEKLRATQANVRAMGEANRMNIELDDYYRMNPHVWRPEGIVGEETTGEISISGLGGGNGDGNGDDQYLVEEVVR